MKNSRRSFIKAGIAGSVLAAGGIPVTAAAIKRSAPTSDGLSILVLGGTGFIGPHMVREALRRGHQVTLFNRGRTNNVLFPDLETIKGDRDNGLDGLKGRRWDVVIDNSGYVPRHVADSANLLAPVCDRYLFISTVSVYADFSAANTETSPLATIPDETVEKVDGETYGALKALCEQRALAAFGKDRLTVLRPTYICGPGDHTDRFTYWPVRTRRGGEMIWPGAGDDAVQVIDVRDLANFTIDCVEKNIPGTFNAVNPPGSCTMQALLRDCRALSAEDVEPVWLGADFIQQHLSPGALPIWQAGGHAFSIEAASAAGLHNRPVRETIRDLLTWWDTLDDSRRRGMRAGLPLDEEAELIKAWKSR